jgi:hypothetical protein
MTLLGVLFVILLLVAMLCFAWVVGPLFLDRDRRRTPSSAARRRHLSVASREETGKAR